MELNDYFKRIFDPAVEYYTTVIGHIENRLPKPELTKLSGVNQWRYLELTIEHMCLLRGIRIISAFSAIRGLLTNGYVQEISVILRTVDEFQDDIVFLLENYPADELSPQQQKFMQEMGKEQYDDINRPFATKTKREPPVRKKVKASVSRLLNPVMNTNDSKEISQLSTDSLSGYVHGTYPHIMELYGGPPPSSHFHMKGMLGTPRIETWMRFVAVYLQRTGPTIGFMCHAFGMEEEFQTLRHMKNWFVKELEESFGCNLSNTPDEALERIKQGKPMDNS
jgi:hypothetical protein